MQCDKTSSILQLLELLSEREGEQGWGGRGWGWRDEHALGSLLMEKQLCACKTAWSHLL